MYIYIHLHIYIYISIYTSIYIYIYIDIDASLQDRRICTRQKQTHLQKDLHNASEFLLSLGDVARKPDKPIFDSHKWSDLYVLLVYTQTN